MACRLVGAKPLSEPILGKLLIGPLGTNFSEILIKIHTFTFKKMRLKMSSGKWKPSCLGLDVLSHPGRVTHVCVSKLHPSPKVMADFFQRQKLPWCPYPICTICGGFIKHMNVFIFCAKYIDFLNQPVLHRGSKCGKRHSFQIKFEHHR